MLHFKICRLKFWIVGPHFLHFNPQLFSAHIFVQELQKDLSVCVGKHHLLHFCFYYQLRNKQRQFHSQVFCLWDYLLPCSCIRKKVGIRHCCGQSNIRPRTCLRSLLSNAYFLIINVQKIKRGSITMAAHDTQFPYFSFSYRQM